MGRFNMGSTVILLFENGRIRWDESVQPSGRLVLGRRIADIVDP
jgi:phosphatidylserine decarboxylase